MSTPATREDTRTQVPFWRNERVLKVLAQIAFAALVFALISWAMSNYLKRGLTFTFGFLNEEASFDLAEGIEFNPTDSYARAFLVGVVNTLRIALLGIVLSTLLGLIAGIARLSSNWIVNKIASVYIEVVRNTPLLVQLFFLYFAVIMKLPQIQDAVVMPGPVYISNRGIALPWLQPTESFALWWPFLVAALLGSAILIVIRRRSYLKVGRPRPNLIWVMIPFIFVPLLGWLIVPGNPLVADLPSMVSKSAGILSVEGGMAFSSEFTALLLGLVIYTGAYIAEVVRAGILAVPKGQTEAARAQGFTRRQILRLIVLPQSLRVIIPPLISQYLNLTKNSSLAIAIDFLDLYAVSQTMLNQSGRVVEVFLMFMGTYLSISLTISLIMNVVNKRFQIVEK